MTLDIRTFVLGPAQTNAYLIADKETKEAAVVDPAWDGNYILDQAAELGWNIKSLWYTHAHFDHIGGAAEISNGLDRELQVGLHQGDLPLWRAGGGGDIFGLKIDPGPEPNLDLTHGRILELGASRFQVRHAPGHSPGLCVFFCQEEKLCFCGDLIFHRGVGRTDLPGGNWNELEKSIREQIYSLPPDTRLFSGHGPETTVGEEQQGNPFVRG